ncbi:sperm flagellar protein 2 [Aplochiton taeniatus]
MSDILCSWLNSELQLSKRIEPKSISRDFANGYLIGEVLFSYQLQDDFHMFLKSNTSNSKLNNFTRIEPTLQLLGVPFDLTMAQAVMQEHQGVVTRLLYQLYIALQNKKKTMLSGTAMETMQPAATACLHKVENEIYSERLKTVVKREADLKLQKISQHYEEKSQEIYKKVALAQLANEQKQLKVQQEMRQDDIEKTRRRQHEIMARIRTSIVQTPKPPSSRTKSIPVAGTADSSSQGTQVPRHVLSKLEVGLQASGDYVQTIRQRLEKDAVARQQREKRRRKVLMEQLKAHEAQEEAQREEQLVERLTRQSQQERRLAVQLLQLRMQKEVIVQNRLLQERQYQEQRQRDFQEALERDSTLAQQAKLAHAEETRKEIELHDKIAAEQAQERYKKHFDSCRSLLYQIVDLATKAGEYRTLTGNLIPGRLMKEWKELLFNGMPLYEPGVDSQQPGFQVGRQLTLEEQDRLEILNNQDYEEYINMKGEWAWPEEAGETHPPPPNNSILGHIVQRLKNIVQPPRPGIPPPFFPHFSLKACMLGKLFSGKTTCLKRIAKVHGLHIISANVLIQEALVAHQTEERCKREEARESTGPSLSKECKLDGRRPRGTEDASSKSLQAGPPQELKEARKERKLSQQALHGAAVESVLMKGNAIPDELLVDIVVNAIRKVTSGSGWILDGFPVDVTQARMLEKALSGSTDPGDKNRRNQRANLAVDINAPKERPPPVRMLDLALLLDVSDDIVLERAAKQACEEQSLGHTGTRSASTTGDPSAQELCDSREIIFRDKSLEKRQIHHRINTFQDTFSKLEKWFDGKLSVLARINAEMDEEELFKKVESVLRQAMYQKDKGNVESSNNNQDSLKNSKRMKSIPPEANYANNKVSETGSGLLEGGQGYSRQLLVSSSNKNCQERMTSPSQLAVPLPGSVSWIYVDEPLSKEIPEYLFPYWENVCESYVTNIKAVMQNLRLEHILIIYHLYDIREEYKQYLCRPDLKQEFVSLFQQDYNSIPDDMRDHDETKAELHQRLDDLLERLWDICDKRREEAGQERAAIMGDGWLEDHTGVLINHYTTLVQVELDRFQDSLRVLRDYYWGMYKPVLPPVASDFTCVPLLDIFEMDEGQQCFYCLSSSERLTKSAGKKELEGDERRNTKVVPLTPRRPLSAEVASSKQKGILQEHPDEKLVHDVTQTALSVINHMVSVELTQMEAEENEAAQQERDRMQRMSQASAAVKIDKNDKKKGPKKKGGPPTPPQEPSPPPVWDESSEDANKRDVRTKIRLEYAAALEHENSAVKVRVELIRACSLVVIRSLQKKADQTFKGMEEWLGSRYLDEMSGIDQLSEVVRHHIESDTKLQSELVLACTDFFINGDVCVVPSPPRFPRPPPREQPSYSTLTVVQLEAMYAQLLSVASSGLLSSEEFSENLLDLTSLNLGSAALPEPWITMSETQLTEIVCMLSRDLELVDWHQFLLSAALPWPLPSIAQLLQVLRRFKMADVENTGYITKEKYLQTELWFPSESPLPIPKDPTEPLSYDRLAHLRKFFFLLFADPFSAPPHLDYMSMLMYLSAHPDPTQGFIRALSVVLGRHLTHHTNSRLLKSVPYIDEGVGEFTELEEELDPPSGPALGCVSRDEGVSIAALVRVIRHGAPRAGAQSRFHCCMKSQLENTEMLMQIFGELGYRTDDTVPFSILSQHPVVQDIMDASPQYQLIDIHRVLQVQQSEGETGSSTGT